MNRVIQYLLHVIIPLLVGGSIYVVWRAEGLQMFRWFELAHLADSIHTIREMYGEQGSGLPSWLLYSLPDAVWVYSFSMYCGLLWLNSSPRVVFSLAAIGPTLGLGAELGQGLRIVPGTFDPVDILLLTAASIFSFIILVSKIEPNLCFNQKP